MIRQYTFAEWCYLVSGRLEIYCGRALAELPAGVESALVTWHAHGVSAFVVAYCLALVAPPVDRVRLDENRQTKPNTARIRAEMIERGVFV